MKKLYLFFLLVVSVNLNAQSVDKSLVLRDSETNLPIEDATVFIQKTKQTLLSNSEGMVSFVLTGISNIQITHSSYSSKTLRSSSLKSNENVIFLKSSITDLDEIIVTKQHPQKILKTLVENSRKKLTVPSRLKVYSREFLKLNGSYTYYNDGLMNFQLFGKDNNFKNTILVEQNRSFGLLTEEIKSDVLGYNLNDIMHNYYNFKYLEYVLNSKAKKQFDFLIKAYSNNNDYNVMLITPLEDSKELLDDFKIVYDWKQKIIIEVSSFVSHSTISNLKEKTATGTKNIYKSLFKTIYRFDNDNYYLFSSKEEIGFERVDKNKTTDIEVRNYFVTTNFSNQNYTYKESEVFKDKTLYNKKNTILSDYWNISGLAATEEEQAIIEQLADRTN